MTAALAAESAERRGLPKQKGPGKSLDGVPVVLPTGIGLSEDQSTPLSLIVHAGEMEFGIAIPDPVALAHAILAASASDKGPAN